MWELAPWEEQSEVWSHSPSHGQEDAPLFLRGAPREAKSHYCGRDSMEPAQARGLQVGGPGQGTVIGVGQEWISRWTVRPAAGENWILETPEREQLLSLSPVSLGLSVA